MAENEHLSDNEELLSPVKNEPADREYTPPPRQRKHRIRRRPTHKATCPKNPSRRLIFSSQDERDPPPARQCIKKKRKTKRRKSGRSKKQKFVGRDIEVSGTWVQCTDKHCMKWRFLSDITDPSHVPDIWTCEMNSDSSYNSCLLPEQDYSSLEFVHSKFTEGSLVWAKMQGFPWWPAMIEEDPDSELCLYPDPVTGYVTDYHVIFLDKKVTRCWIKVSNIRKYEGGDSPGTMNIKGHDYSQRIKAAKEIADEAQKLPIEERIKTFGFSARFKGPWGEEEQRISDESQHAESHKKKKGPKPKKQVIMDEDSSLAGSLLSHSDMDDILDEAEALLGEVQNIVMEVEDEVQESLLQEMEKDENGSPSQKRKAEIGEGDEPPAKQKKGMSKKTSGDGSSKQEADGYKSGKTSKEKPSSEMRMSKELERIQKKKEKEMHKFEVKELKEREKIERREKAKQAKKDQKAREKQEKEEKRQTERHEEQERKEKETQEQKEKAKQEKKEMKHQEKQAKKELKKKEKAEKKALEGEMEPVAEDMETEDDGEKAARKEKKRLEKKERKKLKKEMKAKRKDEKKKDGNEGKATNPKEKGTEKVKPSFQKPKKPSFSAPKQKPVETPPALPTTQPTPVEESSVSREIGALINEIVSDNNQTSEVASEPSMATTDVPAVVSDVDSSVISADLLASRTSPAKNSKKQFKPKFSIKTKDGAALSESNLLDITPSSPQALAIEDGLSALDEEASVDIAKILEVNTKQDSKETTEADPVKENTSDPLAFPLSQMTGKQLELLPKPEHQEDESKMEEPSQDSLYTKEPKMHDVIADSKKILKTLDQPEIQEYSPDPTDWSEPDEPQTVPGQKMVKVAAAAATCIGADSDDDSEPFDMEE